MKYEILNILFSVLILCFSIRTLYVTYNEPSTLWSTDFKGYCFGVLMSLYSIISLVGKFNMFKIYIDICKKLFEIKTVKDGIIFAGIVLLIFIVLGIIYYRPDKILIRYKLLSNDESYAKNKLVVDSALCYSTILILSIYLTIKILNYL